MKEKKTSEPNISLGISPCPNDTFIFHALINGLVKIKGKIAPTFADVERLNKQAMNNELMVTKLSLGVVPEILENYRLLSAGAALGWGCGPLVIARRKMEPEELAQAAIAIPGKWTTANMLLDVHGGFRGERIEMVFNEIMPAVARGDVEAGVIIHEGRFTYPRYNLHKLLDLGEWWESGFHMPLPLGAIAIRRDVPYELAKMIEKAISDSLEYAWKNPAESRSFIKFHAQEMDEEITKKHIATFVTEYSRDLQENGRKAIAGLLRKSLPEIDVDMIFL